MSRSRHSLVGLAALAAVLTSPSQAFLFSQSTQGTGLKHDVRLVDHVVRATVHEGWADVEEDLSLGPQASTTTGSQIPTTNLDSWEIAGDFTLPEGSVLTGALLWNGGTILKAKLKGNAQADSAYEAIVDRNATQIVRPSDPLVIRKNGNNYAMKLFPVNWNGTRHLRIRYLVPLRTDGDGWSIPLGSAFANEAVGHPSQYQMDIDPRGSSALQLKREGMQIPLTRSTKLLDYPNVRGVSLWSTSPAPSYHTPISVALPQKGSIALSTRMDSGSWKGGYVIYKGHLPDTLLAKSSLRQELVVLWKWNSPRSFVSLKSIDGEKQLTPHGQELLAQAVALSGSTKALAQSSPQVRIGLVSDEGDSSAPRQFALSSWASDTFARMQDYLGSLNQDSILNRYQPLPGGAPSETELARERRNGATRFASDLRIAFSLYSADSNVVRHIAFVTAGPANDLPDPFIDLPTWPIGLTASAYTRNLYTPQGAHCSGVDLPTLITQHALPASRQNNAVAFPVPLQRVSWNLEFKAGPSSLSIDAVTGAYDRNAGNRLVEFNGHARAAWDSNLTWSLYDESGRLLRTAQEPPSNWIQLPDDSAVARLWGGSRSHWSESWQARNVGHVFGFVDPSYSLLAIPSDSLGARLQAQYQLSGVPNLRGSEIFPAQDSGTEMATSNPAPTDPRTTSLSKTALAGFSVRTRTGGHGLRIVLPAGLDASSQLVIRDLNGRILARWSGTRLMALLTIDWSAGIARGMLFVELRTGSLRTVQTASIL